MLGWREAPPQQLVFIYIYIYKNKLSVCGSVDGSGDVMSSGRHVVIITMTSLKVFKTVVHGKMFNCKMTEEPTMATAEEAAQRVYAKKLAADRESAE